MQSSDCTIHTEHCAFISWYTAGCRSRRGAADLCVRPHNVESSYPILITRILVDSNVVFWSPEVKVDEQAAFQITLTSPSIVNIGSIPFSRLAIYFAKQESPIIIEHEPSEGESTVMVINLGHITHGEDDEQPVVKGNLRWKVGAVIIFAGSISSSVPSVLKVFCDPHLSIFSNAQLLIDRLHLWSWPSRTMGGRLRFLLSHIAHFLHQDRMPDG